MKKDRRDSEALGKFSYISKNNINVNFNSYKNTKRTQNGFKMYNIENRKHVFVFT